MSGLTHFRLVNTRFIMFSCSEYCSLGISSCSGKYVSIAAAALINVLKFLTLYGI